MSKEDREWVPTDPKDCPGIMDKRNEQRILKMEKRIVEHIDTKLDPFMKRFNETMNVRMAVYALSVVVVLGFIITFAVIAEVVNKAGI